MILPPFYGYSLPYKDQDIYKVYSTYLSQDLLSYTRPTKTVISTYLSQDILTYNKQASIINVTYVSNDLLTYSQPSKSLSLTYLATDILCYDPPPTVPNPPNYVFARDWDTSADVIWTQPSSPRAPITGYNVQYSGSNMNYWADYGDTTGLFKYVTGLTNNIAYKFKVAAINVYGTGLYSISNSVIPSGGDDSYCKLALYLPLNNDILDQSCNVKNINAYSPALNSIELTLSDYKYGQASLYMDGSGYNNNTEYPHLVVSSGQNINWNFSGDFTIDMFVKPLQSSPTATLLSIDQKIVNNTGLIKLHSSGNSIVFDFNQIYYNSDNQQNFVSINSIVATGCSLSSGSWNHLAVVRSNNITRLYFDGQHVGNSLSTSATPYLSGAIPRLGADSNPISNGFAGYMDQIMIFNSAKYRKNFIPSEYTVVKNCDCYSFQISAIDTYITWE